MTRINGLMLKKMIVAGANELNKQKQLVDSLNVFPVPDGDTGTNMSLTALAAARETEKSGSLSAGEIAKLAASGSLRGARGNSGVILSQLFRGFAKGLENIAEAGASDLARAFQKGMKTAYQAVMKPKEGTILTVARAISDAAEKAAEEDDDLEHFMQVVLSEANRVLLETKEMLPVLKQADVVDAGGKGLLCILEGAFAARNLDGDITTDEPSKAEQTDYGKLASAHNTSITFGYCTEFFVNVKEAPEKVLSDFKNFLQTIGDSIIVVSDDGLIKIHVHTDHPGLALEKALTIGNLSGMKIDNMREQHTNKIDFSKKQTENKEKTEKKPPAELKELGFISISMGSGFSEIFKNLGVDAVIEGGQTMNPSTEDILNAMEAVHAKNIIILPNNKNIILAAEQAAKLSAQKAVYVLPTKTVPEGISAMFNYDGRHAVEESIQEMKDSFSELKTAMVTYAVRDTIFGGQKIKEGDILGMLGGEIVTVAKDVEACTKALLDQAVGKDNDMVSLYYGSDVSEDQAIKIVDYLEEAYPDCEVEMHCGNQPLYYYIISVE